MDSKVFGGLINSISRFMHLVACQTMKNVALKDFRSIVSLLKLLKLILDEAFDSELPSDEDLMKAFECLDAVVNEARELVEELPNRMSKIYTVLQSEPIVLKVRKAVTEICYILRKLPESSSYAFRSANIQEVQYVEQNITSELIEHALKDLRENTVPSLEDVIKIMDNLGLSSNEQLLLENIALEKQKMKVELKENTEESDLINEIIVLVTHIRHCVAKLEQFGFIHGLPVPPHFRCPLSLQLMQDPVIVASGQTYERSFIQKWIDNGLRVCPKTRKSLAHTNLIANYTVKALIASWCEDNNIKLGNSSQIEYATSHFLSNKSLDGFKDGDDFCIQPCRISASRFALECHDQNEQQRNDISPDCVRGESCLVNNHQMLPDDRNLQNNVSIEKKSCHSRTESLTSVISSIDITSRSDEKFSLLGAVTHLSCSPLDKDHNSSTWSLPKHHFMSKNEHDNGVGSKSSPSSPNLDDPTTCTHVQKLIVDLKSQAPEVQAAAASEIRLLAKHNMENRVLIADCGAIPSLVTLLHSKVKMVQENAVTALLNLSINNNNKALIAEAGAIEPLIHVLECGSTEARENSAAALFSLSSLEEYKIKIGRSGAVKALVNLLGSGSLRGKKDAATALFNLSIFHENRGRIVQAGAVKCLIDLMDPSTGMLDKSLAVLVNLSMIPEGRLAIVQEGGIPLLVDIVETGSQRGKENAASTLLQLCLDSQKFCSFVLQEGAVPPLIALSQFGTPRAKEKAQQILGHFRSQREGNARRI